MKNNTERNKSLTFNGRRKVDERQMTLDSKEKQKTRKLSEKSKSDFDLTSLAMDQPFEDWRSPPPQQFRDIAPLPPDEFRDPPTVNDEIKPPKATEKKSPLAKVKQQKNHPPLIQILFKRNIKLFPSNRKLWRQLIIHFIIFTRLKGSPFHKVKE
jgi:hypothetical protein